MTELQKYIKALKKHPGMPIASMLTLIGFAAGASGHGDQWLFRGLIGAGVMAIFWIPILLTAWTMRNSGE